jgi:hypothetical protein
MIFGCPESVGPDAPSVDETLAELCGETEPPEDIEGMMEDERWEAEQEQCLKRFTITRSSE